jgi:hypothetical protein
MSCGVMSTIAFAFTYRHKKCVYKITSYWGLVLKCYELRTRQHKMLNVNDLQTKVIKDIPSSMQYMLIEEEAYEI